MEGEGSILICEKDKKKINKKYRNHLKVKKQLKTSAKLYQQTQFNFFVLIKIQKQLIFTATMILIF